MYANLATMHRQIAERYGPRPALRFRKDGLFRDLSWRDYREQADCGAAGLIQLGVEPGDRVGLLSENRYEWLVADHAMLSAGAVTVPLHAPLSSEQVAYQVGHSECRGIIVSTREQAQKVLAAADELPRLEFLITFDSITVDSPWRQLTWQGLKHRGRQVLRDLKDEILRREADLGPDDLATILYTSGTTGLPKGVMLTHGNLVSNAVATYEHSEFQPDDVLLSWLPYSHIYARTVDHYVSTAGGMTLALSASIDALLDDLEAIRPMWMTAVPRFYEKVWAKVETLSPEQRARSLRTIFGPRLRQLSSGGAPLPKHIAAGFFEAGIPLLEGYGLTESSPVICFNRLQEYRLGTVGKPIPDVEVRIAEDGEILTRGPHVMKGYWKNPEATAETIVDGWLHTGDVGRLDDDGFLSITDRKKDLIITSGGKNIAPSEIERLLTRDEWIDQAVVYGDGKPFITALIVPALDRLPELLDDAPETMAVDGNFIGDPRVVAFFEKRVEQIMQAVSRPERVRRFLLLARPFELARDELTATMKVRRRHIISRYESDLEALYQKTGDTASMGATETPSN